MLRLDFLRRDRTKKGEEWLAKETNEDSIKVLLSLKANELENVSIKT